MYGLPRKIIIGSVFVFIVAPLFAYIASGFFDLSSSNSSVSNPPKRTGQDFAEAIGRDRRDLADIAYPAQTIISTERRYGNWYIVKSKDKYDSLSQNIMLIADFYSDENKMVVILPPDHEFYRYNIAFESVPLSVIDEVNKKRGAIVDQYE